MVVEDMDIRQLEHFVAILEAGGQTKAAQAVGVTQQALSKSLARLEDELGARLIERTPKGVTPTRAGARLLETARTVLAETGHLRRDIDGLLGRGPATLVVGLGPIAASGEVGRRIGRFQAQNAGLKIDVLGGLELQFTRALLSGQIDLAVAASMEPADPLVGVQPAGRERWVVVGREGHPLLAGAAGLADLAGAKWLWGPKPEPLERAIDVSFKAAGLPRPSTDMTTTSVTYAMNICAREDFITILPAALIENWPGVISRDLGGDAWGTDLFLMRRRRAGSSSLEAALIAHILAGD